MGAHKKVPRLTKKLRELADIEDSCPIGVGGMLVRQVEAHFNKIKQVANNYIQVACKDFDSLPLEEKTKLLNKDYRELVTMLIQEALDMSVRYKKDVVEN